MIISFFSFVAIPLEMLLFVVEHYKTSTPPPVATTNGDHMATHALTEKKEEERSEQSTSLGMFLSFCKLNESKFTKLMFFA
jgi:hypothetical protein